MDLYFFKEDLVMSWTGFRLFEHIFTPLNVRGKGSSIDKVFSFTYFLLIFDIRTIKGFI